MYRRAREDEGDSDTGSYLQRLMARVLQSERATAIPERLARHGHQSLTSVFLRTVQSSTARAPITCRGMAGMMNSASARLVVMLSLSHYWQGLAAHQRPVQIATSLLCSIPSRHLGLSGLVPVNTCMSAAIVQTSTSVAANCEPRLYVMFS